MNRSRAAFEALRDANPILVASPAPRRFASTLRVALAVIVMTICFLLVAPAVGIRVPVLNFWSADKAPQKIVADFASLSEGAPPGMDPGALSGETRKIALPGGRTLWVAPTRYGGFCTLFEGTGGGCDKLGTVPLGVSWSASRLSREEMTHPPIPTTAFDRVDGWVNGKYADSVEIRFADGETYRPELVWVSEPIDAGFFVYEVASEHRRQGREIEAIVALNGDGEVIFEDSPLARRSLSGALRDKREEMVRLATRDGEAVVWEAPTQYEGRCAWLEYKNQSVVFVPCLPKGYPFPPFALRFVPTRDTVLLVGSIANRYAEVEIQFADGDLMLAQPKRGFLLAELPAEHLVRGREALTIVGRDRAGKHLPPQIPASGLGGQQSPCLAPLPLEARDRC